MVRPFLIPVAWSGLCLVVLAVRAADQPRSSQPPASENGSNSSTIYVETGTRTLKIETTDPEVEVVVGQNGKRVEVRDKKSGTKIAFESGEYQVPPNEAPKEIKREKDRFQLTRNGAAVATISRVKSATATKESPESRPSEKVKYIENKIGMKLAPIPPGEFIMGASREQVEQLQLPEWAQIESPAHKVEIAKGFYMGAFPVTVGQFRKFIEDSGHKSAATQSGKDWQDPGTDQTDEHPVVAVSWHDAEAFCKWLSKKEGKSYRLPTEAEWEYACRAGSRTAYSFGDDTKQLPKYAWFDDNSDRKRHPVGKLLSNQWGLFDMHGNVYQWVADWYDANYYKNSPKANPRGPADGTAKVMRGGEFSYPSWACRSTARKARPPSYLTARTGFRVMCER